MENTNQNPHTNQYASRIVAALRLGGFAILFPENIDPKWGGVAKTLSDFPQAIHFTALPNEPRGYSATGFVAATYRPDPESFHEDSEQLTVTYLSKWPSEFHIEVTFRKDRRTWEGTKYRGDNFVLSATGQDLRRFLIQLGCRGVHDGELVFNVPNGLDLREHLGITAVYAFIPNQGTEARLPDNPPSLKLMYREIEYDRDPDSIAKEDKLAMRFPGPGAMLSLGEMERCSSFLPHVISESSQIFVTPDDYAYDLAIGKASRVRAMETYAQYLQSAGEQEEPGMNAWEEGEVYNRVISACAFGIPPERMAADFANLRSYWLPRLCEKQRKDQEAIAAVLNALDADPFWESLKRRSDEENPTGEIFVEAAVQSRITQLDRRSAEPPESHTGD